MAGSELMFFVEAHTMQFWIWMKAVVTPQRCFTVLQSSAYTGPGTWFCFLCCPASKEAGVPQEL